ASVSGPRRPGAPRTAPPSSTPLALPRRSTGSVPPSVPSGSSSARSRSTGSWFSTVTPTARRASGPLAVRLRRSGRLRAGTRRSATDRPASRRPPLSTAAPVRSVGAPSLRAEVALKKAWRPSASRLPSSSRVAGRPSSAPLQPAARVPVGAASADRAPMSAPPRSTRARSRSSVPPGATPATTSSSSPTAVAHAPPQPRHGAAGRHPRHDQLVGPDRGGADLEAVALRAGGEGGVQAALAEPGDERAARAVPGAEAHARAQGLQRQPAQRAG